MLLLLLIPLATFAAAVAYTLTPGVVFSGDENSSGRRRGGSSSSGESRNAASLKAGEFRFCCRPRRRAVAGVAMLGKSSKSLLLVLLLLLIVVSCGPFLCGVACIRNARSSMRWSRGSASCGLLDFALLAEATLPAVVLALLVIVLPACCRLAVPATVVDVASMSAKGELSGVIDVSGKRCVCREADAPRGGRPGVIGASLMFLVLDTVSPFSFLLRISRLSTSYGDGYSAKRVGDLEGDDDGLRVMLGLLLLDRDIVRMARGVLCAAATDGESSNDESVPSPSFSSLNPLAPLLALFFASVSVAPVMVSSSSPRTEGVA